MESIDFHNVLIQRKTFFCYSGPMREEALTAISASLKSGLDDQYIEAKLQRKVFGVFIEQAQNIIRYSAHRPNDDTGVGTVALSLREGGVVIEAINPISENNASVLEVQLKQLKEKSDADLKKMYKTRLREGPPKNSKGAGLGFIDMARNSTSFDYYFQRDENILFVFRCLITL